MEPSTNIRTGTRDPEVTLVGSVQAPVEAKVKTRTGSVALDLRGRLSRGGCEHPAL
jgi:hypothetical protein